MITEETLKPYCDETGYLTVQARTKFLVDNGIIGSKSTYNDIRIIPEKYDLYYTANTEIDYILKKITARRGKAEIKINDISKDKIDL